MNSRIIAVHLLNDRSGSPLVLAQALAVLKNTHEIILYTATPSGDGFLNDVEGIERRELFYKWHAHKGITLYYFMIAQLIMFFRLLSAIRKGDVVYINTLLPFGAALAAYIRRAKVVYHVHEVSLKPASLKTLLVKVAKASSSRVIFVSNYVASQYRFRNAAVIYNCLPASFIHQSTGTQNIPSHRFTIAMLCSLKAYKGVYHFVNVARKLPSLRFTLVLNAADAEIEHFMNTANVPKNCIISGPVRNTIPIYTDAHVIMNLSKVDGWVETFGMTVLEAMQCGKPVIVPPIGGVCELVTEGVEGYNIDSREEDSIAALLYSLSRNSALYKQMGAAAFKRAQFFSPDTFAKGISQAFATL